MANALFDIYKEALLGGGNLGGTLIDLTSDTIVVGLVDEGTYEPLPATDEDEADLSPDPMQAPNETLGTITVVNGTFDAADSTFTAVSGNSIESLVIFKDTGTPATSPLLVYFDTATGLPVSPNGGDIVIQWNGSGIFSL
jgi:hypothetical protein